MDRCRICRRAIKDDDDEGIGPDCLTHFDEMLLVIETDRLEITALFFTDDKTVQTWLLRLINAVIEAVRSTGGKRMRHLEFAKSAIRYARERATEGSTLIQGLRRLQESDLATGR